MSLFGEPTREFVDRCRKLDVQTYRLVSGRPTAFDTPEHARATIDKYLKDCRAVRHDILDFPARVLAILSCGAVISAIYPTQMGHIKSLDQYTLSENKVQPSTIRRSSASPSRSTVEQPCW